MDSADGTHCPRRGNRLEKINTGLPADYSRGIKIVNFRGRKLFSAFLNCYTDELAE